MVEDNFENVALRNALKLHDFIAISLPWLKKMLRCGTSKCYKMHGFEAIPSLWLKKN